MRNNLLASIALFGIYRNKNLDTYDLVAQYISAVIAQKQYNTFKSETMQSDLKELYQIDIPIGVINSVCRNRIEGISLKNKEFICDLLPKDEIENEYNELAADYDQLFAPLIAFVRKDTQDYQDQTLKDRFAEYLVEGSIDDTKLNNLYAAFISSNQGDKEIRQKIDLLSSGLISYNGLSYTDSSGNSGAWTDKLTIYLDTEFLFSCAGYNDAYPQAVFKEFYALVTEINTSYRRRTKKADDLIELKYFKDTRDIYLSLINSARIFIEGKGSAPDPSKKALMKIIRESQSDFDVNAHQAKIDSVIKETYHIQYDDNDYSNYVTDPRYIIFDEQTGTALAKDYNPQKDETITRKLDYYSRVYTIINGLRGGKNVSVFEKCRVVFLTGSRIGRGASMAVRQDNKTVTLATDIDFLASRFWFKLNKQLIPNEIPVSIDIVARSQAVLTREISRKVKTLYDELKQKNLNDSEQKTLYASLVDVERVLTPSCSTPTEEVLTFINFKDVDELIQKQRELRNKVAEAEKREVELAETKGMLVSKEGEIAGLKQHLAETKADQKKSQETAIATGIRQKKLIRILGIAVAVLVVIVLTLFVLLLNK